EIAIAPLLRATGSAPLAWRRLRKSEFSEKQPFLILKNAYRQHSIEAAIHEVNVRDIFKKARRAGVEPILFKGWALARSYPDDALRPYGDIDLWLPPEDLDKLNAARFSADAYSYCVEPHVAFYPQFERSFSDVFDRSMLVPNDDVQVRIPCPED